MDKDRNSASESEGESSHDETTNINDFASTLINGTANNEPETNATLSQRVFHAAKDGMALTLYALLANQARPQQEELLTSLVRDDDGQECPPIVIAARNGRDKAIAKLITNFGPGSKADPDGTKEGKSLLDLEITGTVKFDGYTIEGATALWSAAGAGHLKTVKRLVRAGADVNHTTTSNSTPLRAACFEGKLDIVAFLVEEGGADVNIANKYDNTCLMISAYKGHEDIVKYLLKHNANVNAKARCGATALHFAAETGGGKNQGVVKALIEQGNADLYIKNEHGVTALLSAAQGCQEAVVEYLLTRLDSNSAEHKIDAFELLGASFANDKDNYDIAKSFSYLEKGMTVRWGRNPEIGPILKPSQTLMPSHKAYDNHTECASPEDLETIRESPDKIHMEGLTIRERILGKANPELPIPIIFRGAVYADLSRFDKCIALWLHALKLRKECKSSVAKDLLRFTQVFSQMLHVGVTINFQDYLQVLKASCDELKSLSSTLSEEETNNKENSKCHNKKKLGRSHDPRQAALHSCCAKEDEMEHVMVIFLYLVVLLSKNRTTFAAEEMHDAMKIIHEVVARIKPKTLKGRTLVHLAVDSETPVDDFHINDVCKFPCSDTTKALLDGGADATAMDKDRNTPLHVIVSYQRIVSDFMTLHSIIGALIEAGAHADVVNMNGQTPMQKASTGVAEIILKSQARMTLKCLSAQAVKRHHVSYQGQVPQSLENFIELHGP